MKNQYLEIYDLLYDHFGSQNWWPGDSPFEIMVGAVLTQNTNWRNVSRAIANIKNAGLMDFPSMSRLSVEEIAPLIKPSGYYNVKSRRLKNLFEMINCEYSGELHQFLKDDLHSAREQLLRVKGIGSETADSILLYACGLPVFVVDTYTHRIFSRHNLLDEESDYATIQETFTEHTPQSVDLYNEYHALIVHCGATYCKKTTPLCEQCPLQGVNL